MSVSVRLSGPPQVSVEGAEVEVPQGKTSALLYTLAYRGEWVSRAELLYLLWPEAGEASARKNLRQLLSTVRRLPLAEGLDTEETRLRWRVESDIAAFGRALEHRDWPSALEHYRGELLQGFQLDGLPEFADWLDLERQMLTARWREAALAQSEALEAAGAFHGALELLARLRETDPLDEAVLQRYLRGLARSGQRNRALDTFGAFRVRLSSELGGEPEPATAALAEAIRRAELAPEAAPLEALTGLIEAEFEEAQGASEAQRLEVARAVARLRQEEVAAVRRERLVGAVETSRVTHFKDRTETLQRLKTTLLNPRTRLVQVGGRGGIGKTALLTKLLLELQDEASPVDATVYLPLREADAYTLESLLSLLYRTLPARQAAVLRSKWEERVSLREKLEFLFHHSLAGRSTLIVLDNLETVLTDEGALRETSADLQTFIETLLEVDTPVVLLVASRQPLALPADLMGRLGARALEVTLEAGLPEAEAVALLRDLDGDARQGVRDAGDALLETVVRRCHGMPRALETLVGTLRQKRTWTLARLLADKTALTRLADDPARELFESLTPEGKLVLQVLAVYGAPVPAVAVRYLLPALAVDDLLDALVQSYAVAFDPREAVFSLHPLDRDYAYRQVPDEGADYSKTSLHRRAAAFYRELRKPPEAWRTLEDLSPQLREVEQLVRAGACDEACKLLNALDEDYFAPWGHAGLLVTLRTQVKSGLADRTLYGVNLYHLAQDHTYLGAFPEALRCAEEALAVFRDLELAVWEARALASLATVHAQRGEPKRALEGAQAALELSRKLEDRTTEGTALGVIGFSHALLGDYAASIDCTKQSLAISRETGNRRREGNLLNNLGLTYGDLGEYEQALPFLEGALELFRDLGDRAREANTLDSLGAVYRDVRAFIKAAACLEQALLISREVGDRPVEGFALYNLGLTCLDQEEAEVGLEYFRQSLAVARETGDRQMEANNLSGLGQAYRHLGEPRKALALWGAAQGFLADLGSPAQATVLRFLSGLNDEFVDFAGSLRALHRDGDALLAEATGQQYSLFGDAGADVLERMLEWVRTE